MTIDDLRRQNLIVLESISGSQAYGLQLPASDQDIKGVFVLPRSRLYGLHYVPQVSNETNDVVFYELGRFMELLLRNNPNLLELLAIPDDCLLYRYPLLDRVRPELFLSQLCRQSFASYAAAQIKKAKGLNKKINKPMEGERKGVRHFCFVTEASGALPVEEWLKRNALKPEACGLVALDHMRDLYALYADRSGTLGYRGIASGEEANDVHTSSVPKGEVPLAYLYFNKDGYSVYCKEYKAYTDWVEKRNEARYQNTLQHGKNYDAKNMMHVFRLLDMAEEIGDGRGLITRRLNREELLRIRSGQFEYDDLLLKADAKLERIEELYARSSLPQQPDAVAVEHLLVELRSAFYEEDRFR